MATAFFEAKEHAALYKEFRPVPPAELIQKMIRFTREKIHSPLKLAVDVGCGSGQSTGLLATHFGNVLGIDVSQNQIKEAIQERKTPNTEFKVATSDAIPLPDQSAQLIFACEAIHWFELNQFFTEVDRVLCENGVLAVTGYTFPEPIYGEVSNELKSLVEKFFVDNVSYWHERTDLLRKRYKDVVLPYETKRIDPIPTDIEASLDYLLGHIWSRSGIQNMKKQNQDLAQHTMDEFLKAFLDIIGKKDENPRDIALKIRFNYFLLLSRKTTKNLTSYDNHF